MSETAVGARWQRVVPALVLLALSAAALGVAAPSSRSHTVEIRGMAFHPADLAVARGDTVVWINRDIVPHTATANDTEPWDTGVVPGGGSGRYVPRRAGAFRYVCALHPLMQGTLVVK